MTARLWGLAWSCSVLAVLVVPAGAGVGAIGPPGLRALVLAHVGPGYVVTAQGALDPSAFAAASPDPAGTGDALSALAGSTGTYERTWRADGGRNQVQVLLVRFSSATRADAFLGAAQRDLAAAGLASNSTLPAVPGARRVTYFGTAAPGVGEAITMRAGIYVAVVTFYSASANNPHPVSPRDAARVAVSQHAGMVTAAGGTSPVQSAKPGATASDSLWALLVVVVLAGAVVTPMVLRNRARRRVRGTPLGSGEDGLREQ